MNLPPLAVLLIEDNPADARLVSEYFAEGSDPSCLVTHASTFAEAVSFLEGHQYDVILLDLSLPDSHGLETLHRMHAYAPQMPIIVFTGLDDDELALSAMRHGAQDYLLKGKFDLNLLIRAIRYTMERKRAEAEIKQLAYYDTLTGLPNRTLLMDRLRQALVQAEREQRHAAVFFLDLDRFKSINDSLGHSFGDQLLQIVARRLKECIRSSDTVSRLGGDEFIVVLNTLHSLEDAVRIARKIIDAVSVPITIEGHELFSTVSIGISLFPADGAGEESLLKSADLAMYRAKERGRNTYQFFSQEMNQRALARQQLETQLRRALQHDEFALHYQPLIDMRSNRLIGMEALLRWQHPERGMVGPDEFIPLAEETGLIIPIGEWVLRTACAQTKTWQDEGYRLRVGVNISARQFKQPDFVASVATILAETGLPPATLELELTETALVENIAETITTLNRLKGMGINLAIDDFGTGYSSLSYLKHFPIDRLKIDRTFISEISTNSDDAVIAETIIAMAHSLRKSVVAEGVEHQRQLDFLSLKECDEVQGFYLSKPLPPETFTHFLRQQSPDRD